MLDRLFGGASRKLERAFARASRDAPTGPLADFYRAGLPDLAQAALDAPIVVIDLETDGLDRRKDAILEAGTVAIEAGAVQSGSARRIRFRSAEPLNAEAVVVHRITDDEASAAQPVEHALQQVLQICAGKVLVAHFAEIEANFIDTACRAAYGAPFVAPFICTMQLEARWFPRVRAHDGLRLGKLRSQYGLPTYVAHDGLTDALACAELFLAQIVHAQRQHTPVGELLRH
ncbi:MAG: exonuclease domain-containing protein [Erythrobacter sp.]